MSPRDLEQQAFELLAQLRRLEWENRDASDRCCAAAVSIDHLVMQQLIKLTTEAGHKPVESLRPMIKEILCERVFTEEAGDATLTKDFDRRLDCEVSQLIDVLERSRDYLRATSGQPAG